MKKDTLQFSIVIAAKNEEKNLSLLFNSFKNLNYLPEDFEIIFIDDNSEDSTFLTAKGYQSLFPNLRIIKAADKEYPGKKGALALGIKEARFDYILITDADCQVGKDWLKHFSDKFSEGFDFLFGEAPFIEKPGFINAVSRFENLRSFFLYKSALKLNLPFSAAARNFGFKKSSFNKVRGYENTRETLSGDDDLLIREAVKNKMRIGFVDNKEAAVFTFSKETLHEYLVQKTRHTKTSLYYLPVHRFLLAAWHLINLGCLLSFPIGFINHWFFLPPLLKISLDILIVKTNENKAGYKFGYIEIIYLQISYEFMIIINFINALLRKDKWS